MVPLELYSVGVLQDSPEVIMILRAPHTGQLLVMNIGPFEGQAIAQGVARVELPRPMTHDLLVNTIGALGGRIQKVLIRDLRDQTFFATIYVEQADGRVVEIDARPSDAVACAVRTGAPIFADPMVMALAGVYPSDDGDEEEPSSDVGDNGDSPHIH